MKKVDVEFPEPLLDKVDQILGIILTVTAAHNIEDIIVVDYPHDVPSWATFGIAVQIACLYKKTIWVYNSEHRFNNRSHITARLGSGKIFSNYNLLKDKKYTRFVAEMTWNTPFWTFALPARDTDEKPLEKYDYLTAAVIASFYGCPKKYLTWENIKYYNELYEDVEGIVHVEKL